MNRLLDYIIMFQLARSHRTMVSSIIYYARGYKRVVAHYAYN